MVCFWALAKKSLINKKFVKLSLIAITFISLGLSFYLAYYLYFIAGISLFSVIYLAISKKFKHDDDTSSNKGYKNKLYRQKEKEDLKKFFEVKNKKLVFYSENGGYYKYFENYIDYILDNSDIVIHYITSDFNDNIFKFKNSKLKTYYISEKKLIFLMMKLEADIVVMTMPDLQNFHIKRSLVSRDIEYIYVFHAPLSFLTTIRHGALDHYDTIFSTGKFQDAEIRESEKLYNLKPKNIVKCGYGLIENMRKNYLDNYSLYNSNKEKQIILIAPSWFDDNILDSCLTDIVDSLLNKGWQLMVRPHPEYLKRFPDRWNSILSKYHDLPESQLGFDSNFSSTERVFSADLVISDWSWISYEFALAVQKPVLFINTKMKIVNPYWDKIPLEPLNITLRSQIGIQLEIAEINNKIEDSIRSLLLNKDIWRDKIEQIQNDYLYNFGSSGEVGGKYIISRINDRLNTHED
jgi:YidC/Oxa1 family membrane protein insertase